MYSRRADIDTWIIASKQVIGLNMANITLNNSPQTSVRASKLPLYQSYGTVRDNIRYNSLKTNMYYNSLLINVKYIYCNIWAQLFVDNNSFEKVVPMDSNSESYKVLYQCFRFVRFPIHMKSNQSGNQKYGRYSKSLN